MTISKSILRKCFEYFHSNGRCAAGYEGSEMMSLEEEISHLQKENSQVDSQLHRIKSDVGGMETDASSEDKVRDKLQQAELTSVILC